jgi:paraquat-inducible protein A
MSAQVRECPDCGLFHTLPPLPPHTTATCLRCEAVLQRPRRDPVRWPLALSLTGLILYAVALTMPFMAFDMRGRETATTLLTAARAFVSDGAWELGLAVFVTVILMPLLKLGVLLTVSLGLSLRQPPRWLYAVFRWYRHLSPWAMIEVYLIGVFVAYTRLIDMARIDLGDAAYALAGLMLVTVAADVSLDSDAVWEELERHGATARPRAASGMTDAASDDAVTGDAVMIGCTCCRLVSAARPGTAARCPRCGSRLYARKPNSLARCWTLLIAAAILYLPANLFPVLTIISFGHGHPNTILGGVQELIDANMLPIAILVFAASITVPLLKLIGLTLMLVSVHRGSGRRLRDRTRLYRIVDVIGRWSMIDIFMLSVLVALVRLGFLATVEPGIGAISFAAVVVLTMFAANAFDPRLMWDAAGPAAAPMRARGAASRAAA